MQARFKKANGRFGSFRELAAAATTGGFDDLVPADIRRQVDLTGAEIVPGFAAELRLGSGSRSYVLRVVAIDDRDDSRFAYGTDESGAIHEGRQKGTGKGEQSFLATEFVGAPISRSKNATPSPGLASVGRSIMAFFFPTVYAFGDCAVCGNCFNGDANACGSNCARCCNIGYDDCRWCCMTWDSCTGCPF
jgi:hypothetical protein